MNNRELVDKIKSNIGQECFYKQELFYNIKILHLDENHNANTELRREIWKLRREHDILALEFSKRL